MTINCDGRGIFRAKEGDVAGFGITEAEAIQHFKLLKASTERRRNRPHLDDIGLSRDEAVRRNRNRRQKARRRARKRELRETDHIWHGTNRFAEVATAAAL